jgi:hypothetical protein
MTPSIGLGRYVVGCLAVAAVLVALGWGARRVRAAALPGWHGAPARLVEVVLGLSALSVVAQLLGAVGAFSGPPLLVGYVATGIVGGVVAGRLGAARSARPDEVPVLTPPSPLAEGIAAAVAVAVVLGQMATHVAVALGRGITHPDSMWYQAPYAARFVQLGKLTGTERTLLEGIAYPLHAYLPLNSSVLHAVAVLPFGTDFLPLFVNVAAAALTLLAAWCVGRGHGVGALSLLGGVVVLSLPTIAGSQAGQATNDVLCAGLFLAAVALLLETGVRPAPAAVAGLAAGLSLGIKLNVAVPVAVLTVGVVVLALWARRPLAAVWWFGAMAVTGSFWFLRNWVVASNPLPIFEIDIGPIHLPTLFTEEKPTLAGLLFDADVWDRWFLPGFRQSFGWAWPLLLALVFGGAVLALVLPRRRGLERLAGAVVLLGVVGYVNMSHTGDLEGAIFVLTTRYLAPVLLVGLGLLALVLAGAPRWARFAGVAAMGVVVVIDAFARHYDRTDNWPTGYLAPGAVVAAVVLIGAALLRRRQAVPHLWAGASATAALLVVGGYVAQDHFLASRYLESELPLDDINAAFRDVRDERVAVFGTEELYPMFGPDLSNRVTKVAGPQGGTPVDPCRWWRQRLNAGRFGYVVVADPVGFVPPGPAPEVLATDPAATTLVDADAGTVFRIDGDLDPTSCPASEASVPAPASEGPAQPSGAPPAG